MSYRSPQELVEAFRDWGVPIRAYEPDGRPWYSHTTNGGWNPKGTLHHHTAGSRRLLHSNLSRRAMLRLLRNGRTGLPGPLCHFSPAMDGDGKAVLWLVGWGNCNHAGMGDAVNLSQIKAGNYRGRNPRSDSVDGNPTLYGLEYQHPGDSTPWPEPLLEVGHLTAAAICDAHGWDGEAGAHSNLEHRDFTRRKIDRSWHGDVQQAVLEKLQAGPAGRGDDVSAADVWNATVGGHDASLMLTWASNRAKRADRHTRGLPRKLKRLQAGQDQLAADLQAMRDELPELVEHAAAVGARKALEDSVVRASVDVTVDGTVTK